MSEKNKRLEEAEKLTKKLFTDYIIPGVTEGIIQTVGKKALVDGIEKFIKEQEKDDNSK